MENESVDEDAVDDDHDDDEESDNDDDDDVYISIVPSPDSAKLLLSDVLLDGDEQQQQQQQQHINGDGCAVGAVSEEEEDDDDDRSCDLSGAEDRCPIGVVHGSLRQALTSNKFRLQLCLTVFGGILINLAFTVSTYLPEMKYMLRGHSQHIGTWQGSCCCEEDKPQLLNPHMISKADTIDTLGTSPYRYQLDSTAKCPEGMTRHPSFLMDCLPAIFIVPLAMTIGAHNIARRSGEMLNLNTDTIHLIHDNSRNSYSSSSLHTPLASLAQGSQGSQGSSLSTDRTRTLYSVLDYVPMTKVERPWLRGLLMSVIMGPLVTVLLVVLLLLLQTKVLWMWQVVSLKVAFLILEMVPVFCISWITTLKWRYLQMNERERENGSG